MSRRHDRARPAHLTGARPPRAAAPARKRRGLPAIALLLALSVVGGAQYTVRPGDTLSAIAARHGVTVAALAEANDLSNPDLILAGSTLTVPSGDQASGGGGQASGGGGQASGAGGQADSGGTTTHSVRPGEHLTGIATLYGLSVPALVSANNLRNPDFILAGTTLTIPGGAGGSQTSGTSGAGVQTAALSRSEVGDLIERVAVDHGWSPAFVKAVAWQESGWRNEVTSHAGAVGIMQVMPGTGDFISRRLAGRPLDLRDPEDNVLAGVLYLDYLYGLTGRDAERTLAGYYQGLASVNRNGMFASTQRYIANVLSLRERFR